MLSENELRLLPRLTQVEARFWSKVAIVDDDDSCWLWLASVHPVDGYGQFSWRGPDAPADLNSKSQTAHRVAFYLTHGYVGEHTCHTCDVRACVRPSHLFAGSALDNIADRHAKGRSRGADQRGERNHYARLNDEAVLEIRALATQGLTHDAIALRYGVTRPTITYIVQGKTWRHLL